MNKNSVILSTPISQENIQAIGEIIAISAMKQFVIHNRKYERLYRCLIKDCYHHDDYTNPLSDAYDFVQTAICFLWQHKGKTVHDVIRYNQWNDPIYVIDDCYKAVNHMILERHRDYKDKVDIETIEKTYDPFNETTIDYEAEYDRIENIINQLELTPVLRETLDLCYNNSSNFSEIAREMHVTYKTIVMRRKAIQEKYLEYMDKN